MGTVDGRNPANSPVEVGSLSRYSQGFLHPRWCRISSNGISDMVTLPETSIAPEELVGWKMNIYFWDGLFSGAILNFRSIYTDKCCPDLNWS